jgi:hypothetical protein
MCICKFKNFFGVIPEPRLKRRERDRGGKG